MICRDVAWVGDVVKSNDLHPIAACSNKGICDRKTGLCRCFENYEGLACERTICPNNCNDRGVCMSIHQLATESNREYTVPWDSHKQYGCSCDLGFRGIDCSLIECPSGPDPMKGHGNEQGRDCSGRGICDYSRGTCKCFAGFGGTRCHLQVRYLQNIFHFLLSSPLTFAGSTLLNEKKMINDMQHEISKQDLETNEILISRRCNIVSQDNQLASYQIKEPLLNTQPPQSNLLLCYDCRHVQVLTLEIHSILYLYIIINLTFLHSVERKN